MTEYELLKEKYANLQDEYLYDNDEVKYEESKIYEELLKFIKNKYPEFLFYLEDLEIYDQDLMKVFLTSGNERNFINRVIKGYGVSVDDMLKGLTKKQLIEILEAEENIVINKYLDKKVV